MLASSWMRLAACALALALTAAYLLVVGPYWNIGPDSETYIESAENLAAFRGYGSSMRGPVPSMIYAVPIYFSPGNYLLLNGVNAVFSLLSAAVAYFLFRRHIEPAAASLIALLLLASTLLLEQSTTMLSDVFYLLFSLAALGLYSTAARGHQSAWRAAIVGFVIMLACLSRVVGLALILAVLTHQALLWVRPSKESDFRPLVCLSTGAALAVLLGWEIRNHLTFVSMFDLALQRDIWIPANGYNSATDMVQRLVSNLVDYRWIGDILINQNEHHEPILQGPIRDALAAVALGGALWGFAVRGMKAVTELELYTIIYLAAVGLFENAVFLRWFLPVVPLLLYYFLSGCADIAARLKVERHPKVRGSVQALAACYILIFFASTVTYSRHLGREAHYSPFGKFPIKYRNNHDLQGLALWYSGWAKPDQPYLTLHAPMIGRLTRQQAHRMPFTSDPNELIRRMAETGSQYLLADKQKPIIRQLVLPAIRAREDRFEIVRDAPNAAVYKYTPTDTP